MGLREKKVYDHYGMFFITTTCHNWLNLLSCGKSMEIVCSSINFCLNKYQTLALGFVFMPNHIHLILRFKNGMERVGFMRDFKKYTSVHIRKEVEQEDPELLESIRISGQKSFKVWQDRFDEKFIVSRWFLEEKLEYIHCNPTTGKWKLSDSPENYKFSSAAFYSSRDTSCVKLTHYSDFF